MSRRKLRLHYFETDKVVKEDDKFEYIYVTDFDDDALEKFYKKFLELNSDEEVKIIPIVISSYGGSVYTLLSMLDLIKIARKPVATIAIGKAMSCGAVLLSAGTKGFRFSGPETDILIHEVSSAAWGKNSDIQNDAKQTNKLNIKLMGILAKNCGKKDKNYFLKVSKSKGNTDLYYSAKQAKALGLIDYDTIPELFKS